MKILLSGSHGLIGSALKNHLERAGHRVTPLHRDFTREIDFNGVDAVIHLAGEPIADTRWNDEKKQLIRESRVDATRQLTKAILRSDVKPKVYVTASAIGYYGDRRDETLTEESLPGIGFLPGVCKAWEVAAELPEDLDDVRTIHLRTGIVLSEEGGALQKMLTPFKMGMGGKLGNGKQYMSWISIHDMIHAIEFMIKNDSVSGPINMTAPNPVTNQEFTKTLGRILHKPTLFPLPAFIAKKMFGEMAEALLLSSARVLPEKLTVVGYSFKHEYLNDALKDILE